MRPAKYWSFIDVIAAASHLLQHESKLVHSAKWQGMDIASRPEMATHEVAHVSFQVPMHSEDPALYHVPIQPNLPWADDHFEERVCGQPINPGIEWAKWPYGKSAERFLEEGKFNHNYMERYWPKDAGHFAATETADEYAALLDTYAFEDTDIRRGIRYQYGDLADVVKLLAHDPYTRQAYLPVWFPEDTGGGSKRAPCTIGYHFLMRDGKLDVTYQIRSCDFMRHFRDDIYLTVRLAIWVINEARKLNPDWEGVIPGTFVMSIQSLHIFRNDYHMLFEGK